MEIPVSFIENTKRLLGEAETQVFLEALAKETPVSIRLNPGKDAGISTEEWTQIPWCPDGYYLPKRPTFTFDPLFHAGCYYVQEASSMFLAQVVRTYVKEPVIALDMCAAPGGKSTLLRDTLPEGSLLVANEVIPQRAQVLAENLMKWGHPGVVVTHSDSAEFIPLKHFFDVILTDVPCSGEGMFRKDEVAVKEWSMENVETCWQRQRMIVENVWQSLKPGGLLIYSTCTFNLWEDELNVRWIKDTLGAELLEVPVQEEWKITSALGGESLPVYRFLPHKTVGEGLFMAVLRKNGDEVCEGPLRKKDKKNKQVKKQPALPPVPKECKSWLKEGNAYLYQWHRNHVMAFPKQFQEQWEILSSTVNVIHAGVSLATMKGKDIIPEHSLAMSQVAEDVFPHFELTYEQAVAYLRKEAILLEPDTPKGFVLVTYRKMPLGFVKNIGNRANNLYPQEWRIRSGYTPEELLVL